MVKFGIVPVHHLLTVLYFSRILSGVLGIRNGKRNFYRNEDEKGRDFKEIERANPKVAITLINRYRRSRIRQLNWSVDHQLMRSEITPRKRSKTVLVQKLSTVLTVSFLENLGLHLGLSCHNTWDEICRSPSYSPSGFMYYAQMRVLYTESASFTRDCSAIAQIIFLS